MKKWITLVVAVALPTTLSLASEASTETLALYKKKCANCHGTDGKGDTKMGKKLEAKDYTDPKVQESLKDDKAFAVIREGLKTDGKTKMKPDAELTDAQIKDLIAHMKQFGKK